MAPATEQLPPETAIRILRELGDAVAYAHDRGVLHLDLKPDNVMIDAEGHVRVLDFGLAQKHRSRGSPKCTRRLRRRPRRMQAASGWSRSDRMCETTSSASRVLPTNS